MRAEDRLYINVPKAEKDEAKELGARWDRSAVSWYVPEGVNPEPLTSRWPQHEPGPKVEATWEPPLEETREQSGEKTRGERESVIPREERQYLTVPFKEKDRAKAFGARWDGEEARWYAGPNADMEKLSKYLPEKQPSVEPGITPREELAAVLKSIGAKVEGSHPIMDKKSHRIEVEGDGKGEKSGFYVGHPDGKPAGYAINNRTKEERYWVSTGHVMDDMERDTLRQKAVTTLKERNERLEITHAKTAVRLEGVVAKAKAPKEPTPYMQAKGIEIHDGVHSRGTTTCVPAYDAAGKIKSVQYIQEDGSKSFAKNSERKGAFHAVGGLDELKKAPVIIIAEGYATAASIKEATGRPAVAAFDAGNLVSVAKALKEAMPDKPIVIAGDNDLANEGKPGGNAGKKFALEAAEAVGGQAVFPTFASGEVERDPKGFSDFNDLANKSVLGKEAIASQLETVIEMQIEKAKAGIEKTATLERSEEKAKSKGNER